MPRNKRRFRKLQSTDKEKVEIAVVTNADAIRPITAGLRPLLCIPHMWPH